MSRALMRYAVLALAVIAVPAIALSHAGGTKHAHAKSSKGKFETITIKKDMTIEGCEERDMDEYVFFIYSKYCPHCKKAMPIVEEIVKEEKIGSRYLPIDTASDEGREMLKQYGIRVQYVPTLIKDCKAYVGSKKREVYEKALGGDK